MEYSTAHSFTVTTAIMLTTVESMNPGMIETGIRVPLLILPRRLVYKFHDRINEYLQANQSKRGFPRKES